MEKLPEYFVIKRDANNPLWRKYIDWLNEQTGRRFDGTAIYYGRDGNEYYKGYDCNENVECFLNSPTLLTLDQWNAIVNPKPKSPKKNLIPFDLKKWQEGAKPFTRDGKEVKQLTYFEGLESTFCMGGVVETTLNKWNLEGAHLPQNEALSLMLEAPAVESFINFYPGLQPAAMQYQNSLDACKQSRSKKSGATHIIKVTQIGEEVTAEIVHKY